ncbi:MAG TPA: glycosyltransferase [Candidatus Competibacteraceae bacterium]|nr:glycosyltransferase [Candidatus Competibacteraceae bacterium]
MMRLRAGFITTSFPLWPGSTSGPFIAQLVRELAQYADITVLTPCTNRPIEIEHSGFETRCFRYAPRQWQILAHLPGGVPAALRNHRLAWLLLPGFFLSLFVAVWRLSRHVDVLHANWSVTGALAGLIGLFSGTPVITTLRGEDFNRARHSGLYRRLLDLCLRFSRKVTVVGEAMHQNLVTSNSATSAKIVFLPNGVSETFIAIPPLPACPEDAEAIELLYLGNLISSKGVDVLLKACAEIRDQERWVLHVVGAGPESEPLQTLTTALELPDRVRFAGSIPPERIPELLARSTVLILPSYREGRSNAVLEGMASGRVVIASDIPGVRELIRHGENGFLFKVGDPVELARILRSVLENSERRRRLGAAARQWVIEQNLTWPATARRYVEIYREASARHAGNRS